MGNTLILHNKFIIYVKIILHSTLTCSPNHLCFNRIHKFFIIFTSTKYFNTTGSMFYCVMYNSTIVVITNKVCLTIIDSG